VSFDLLAPHYTWMEAVLAGRRLQRCRTTWLDALEGCERILIAGVGHGHFLKRCTQRFPQAHITSVDASAGMLHRAERRVHRAGAAMERLAFVHAALPEWTPRAGSFDAIATHFFLDCFPPDELPVVVAALADAARPSARWLLSDFAVPSEGLARQRARAVHALMYGFFRHVTRLRARRLTEPDPLLRAHGFTLAGRQASEWGLLRADCWVRGDAALPGRFAVG
jgi:ubiquinone/menaquinone biosynthesis C-methylase UbiE